MIRFYRAILVEHQDSDPEERYHAIFPDLPRCAAKGGTKEAVGVLAIDAAEAFIHALTLGRKALPDASDIGEALPPWLQEWPDGHVEIVAEILVPVTLPANTVQVEISLGSELLRRIDAMAEREGMTRSGYLSRAAQMQMNQNMHVLAAALLVNLQENAKRLHGLAERKAPASKDISAEGTGLINRCSNELLMFMQAVCRL